MSDDLPFPDFPQARSLVRAARDQIGRVGRKRAVPDPPLVVGQRFKQRFVVHVPEFYGVVRAGGRQIRGIGAQTTLQGIMSRMRVRAQLFKC